MIKAFLIDLAEKEDIRLITEAEVTGLTGNGKLDSTIVTHQKDGEIAIETDHFVPLFGLKPSFQGLLQTGG